MRNNNIYINAIKQISVQQPLTDEWFENPVFYSIPHVRAVEPDYKQFFMPNELRRLGKILKRALLVSRQAMQESGVPNPDAIITSTGLGCIENTEIFLDKMVREGEEFLNPTHFMQSTHNTISSLIAIDAKCNSYNTTYAHKGISFECALQDAFMQLTDKTSPACAKTVLVGAHDEMIPAYFNILKKAGYLGLPNQTFGGENAVAMLLSAEKSENSFCKIEMIEKIYCRSAFAGARHALPLQQLPLPNEIDYVMVGTNGTNENDQIYFENCAKLFPNIPLLHYKHLFGEGYTIPALGVYAAALCLKNGKVPDFLKCDAQNAANGNCNRILCYNHFEGKNHTFITLSK